MPAGRSNGPTGHYGDVAVRSPARTSVMTANENRKRIPTSETVPYYTAVGSGPTIICLHSSTSSSKQWQSLTELLSDKYKIVSVDLYGYGKTEPWKGDGRFSLKHEAALIDRIIRPDDSPLCIIGHSYGGAVALKSAMLFPEKIRNIVIYEPTLFCLLSGHSDLKPAFEEISSVSDYTEQQVREGDLDTAARRFIDYWTFNGFYDNLPDHRKQIIGSRITKVVQDFEACFECDMSSDDIIRINKPALLLYGLKSPASTRRIARLLTLALPDVEIRALPGLGHMGPVTHSERVNEVIADFLFRHTE